VLGPLRATLTSAAEAGVVVIVAELLVALVSCEVVETAAVTG
jgi:hypothetical protein